MNEKIKFKYVAKLESGYSLSETFLLDDIEYDEVSHWRILNGLIGREIIRLRFTGAKDDSNNDIYEGDIIEIELSDKRAFTDGKPDKFRIVVFYGQDCCFHGKRTDAERESLYAINFGGSAVIKRRVIGNIFENPDLK